VSVSLLLSLIQFFGFEKKNVNFLFGLKSQFYNKVESILLVLVTFTCEVKTLEMCGFLIATL
jgi:hypothetical protein